MSRAGRTVAAAAASISGSAASPMDMTEPEFAGTSTNAALALTGARGGFPPRQSSDPAESGSVASSDSSALRRRSHSSHRDAHPPMDAFAASIEQLKATFSAGTPPPQTIEEGARSIELLMRDCTQELLREELLCLLLDIVQRHPLLCTVLALRRCTFLKSCKKWAEQFAKALSDHSKDLAKTSSLLVQLLDFLKLLPSTAMLIDLMAANAAHPTFNHPAQFLHGGGLTEARELFLALEASLTPSGTVVALLQQTKCRMSSDMKRSVLASIAGIVQHWRTFDAKSWWQLCEAQSYPQGASVSSSSSSAASSPPLTLDTQFPGVAAAGSSFPSVLLSPTASDAEDLCASTSGFSGVDAAGIDGPMRLSHPPHSGGASPSSSSSPVAKKPRRGAANADLPRFNAQWNNEPVVISSDEEEEEAESRAAPPAAAAAAGITPPVGSKRKRVEVNTDENTVRRFDPTSFTFFDDPNFKLKSILKGSSSGAIASPPRARLTKSVSDSVVECRSSAAAAAASAPASILPARYAHLNPAAQYRDLLSLPPMSLSPLNADVTSQLLGGFIPPLSQCLPAFTTLQGRFAPGCRSGGMTHLDLNRAFAQGIFPCLSLAPEGHRWLPQWSLLFAQLARLQELHYASTQRKAHNGTGQQSNSNASGSNSSASSAPLPPLGTLLASVMDPLVGRHWTEEFVLNRPVDLATLMEIAKGKQSYEGAATAAAAAAAAAMAANSPSAAAASSSAAAASSSSSAASPRTANGTAAPAATPASFMSGYAAATGPEPRSPVPQFGPQDHDEMARGRRNRY